MFGKNKDTAPRDNIEAAWLRVRGRHPKANIRAFNYLRRRGRPKNAPEDSYDRKEGREARDWPLLDTSWLSDFPDFPFHVEGLHCCYIGGGRVNCEVYASPKDKSVIQDLVLLGDARLDEAFETWPLPEFGHTVPFFEKRDENVIVWPANYAKIHMRPYTRGGRLRDKPFSVGIRTPVWRKDGFFDESILDVTLDVHFNPVYLASEYRVYTGNVGMDRVIVNSYLDDDGVWKFHWVESDMPRHRKTYVDPKGT